MRKLETFFEKTLWSFRFVILLGVIGLLITSLIVFIFGLSESFEILHSYTSELLHKKINSEEGNQELILSTVEIIDHFLLGIVLLIFGLGTYDLFISRIDIAKEQKNVRPHWLVFNSLDELKTILGKVVIMMLIVKLLEWVVQTNQKLIEPLHFLYLGGAIALIGLAMYLSHGKDIDKTQSH